MADACIFLLENVDFIETYSNAAEIRNTQINVGTGIDISIRELAFKIKKIVGYQGDFYFNTEKPDGTIQKLTDISKINKLGWIHTVTLDEGLEKLYNQYIV